MAGLAAELAINDSKVTSVALDPRKSDEEGILKVFFCEKNV